MSLWKILLYGFLIYMLYQLLFNFIIPVYRTTKKVKKGFREMSARMNRSDGHERMNEQMKQQQTPEQPSQTNSSTNSVGEYIDFEEVE